MLTNTLNDITELSSLLLFHELALYNYLQPRNFKLPFNPIYTCNLFDKLSIGK